MQDAKMTGRGDQALVQVWITVSSADGSSRLESRWTSAEQAVVLHATHAA